MSEDGWEGKAIGLLDLDAFFASVEQLDHPEWRGLPVIVGGDAESRGVVSTCSYEARAYGVHSAMPSAQARKLCPNAIWTHGRYDRYREMSDRVMAVLDDETPYVEQVSIDEAFFDITPGRFSRESPVRICERIRARVADLGVTCSVGLATSKSVAKIASEVRKPNGLTVVEPGTEAAFLAPMGVRALSGIGASSERRLAELGIRTLGQLANAPADMLESALGAHGLIMRARARGEEGSTVTERAAETRPKSVSNERTFARDLTDEEEIRAAIGYVSERVGSRLRAKGLKGRTVTLKVLLGYRNGHTAQTQLAAASDDESVFGAAAQGLLGQIWREGMGVRLVGVGVSGFDEPGAVQQSLFDADAPEAQDGGRRALSVTADEVRARFGKSSLGFGRDLRLNGIVGKDR